MTSLISDVFKTNLGLIKSWIETDSNDMIPGHNAFNITTQAHEITLEVFELKNEWLPENMKFETSKGWRWHIRKINTLPESLIIYCNLVDPAKDCQWSPCSGEYLDAIEIEDKTNHLHIGTEDGEMLKARANNADEMPNRFKDELDMGNSFTHYTAFGFKTLVPELKEDETIYFHYLVATNTIKQSLIFPDERDVSTWYAVEKAKTFLDRYLGIGKS